MLDTLLSWYSEPLFWLYPVASVAISAFMFMLFAGPLTWLAARAPARFEPHRIQSRRARAQTLLWPSLKWWLLNNLLLGVSVIVAWPLLVVRRGPLRRRKVAHA